MPDVVRFRGHGITYDKAGLVLVPFVDRNTKEEHILIKLTDDDQPAMYLDELKPVQLLETTSPFDINHTYNNLDAEMELSSSYDPDYDDPDDRFEPTYRNLIIVRVDSDEKDRVRAVFSGTDDNIPVFVAACGSNVFNELDVGNVITINESGRRSLSNTITHTMARGILHAQWDKQQRELDEYKEVLGYGKVAYTEKFLKGDLDEMFIDIFTVRGQTMYYTDTELTIHGKAALARVLKNLSLRDVDKSTDLVMNTRRATHAAEGNDWYGFDKLFYEIVRWAGSVTINGVKVKYEVKKRTVQRKSNKEDEETYDLDIETVYVNGKRIAWDDVETVVTSATCYGHNQERYDEYVQSVCKVSLKYHRAVLNGMELIDSYAYNSGVNETGAVHLPNDYGDYGTTRVRISSALVPFRKEHGSKAEIFLDNEWRKVTSFDALSRSLESNQRMVRSRMLSDVPSGARKYDSILRRLSYLDNFLVEEDRIFKPDVHFMERPEDDRDELRDRWGAIARYPARGDFMNSPEAVAELNRIGETYVAMFGESIKEQYDVLRRSKELFDRIVEQEKVVVSEDEKEFTVTGTSGKKYRITTSGSVTDLASGRHICIVNGGSRELGGWDYLTSLIAALAHDNRTAQSVRTLKV
jgi:hypothetical protein